MCLTLFAAAAQPSLRQNKKNGEGDLVVMDIETFSRRESMLKLREQLISVEEDRLAGIPLKK